MKNPPGESPKVNDGMDLSGLGTQCLSALEQYLQGAASSAALCHTQGMRFSPELADDGRAKGAVRVSRDLGEPVLVHLPRHCHLHVWRLLRRGHLGPVTDNHCQQRM